MSSKIKTTYCCVNCGASFPKWMGQCSQCGEWNSIKEEVVRKQQSNKLISKENKVKEINEIESLEKERIIFELSSSYLDKWVFDYRYPKSTGYINLSYGGWGTAA